MFVDRGQMKVSERIAKNGKRTLAFDIDGKIITSLQYGDDIFKVVAQHMYRLTGKKVYIYISDLSLPLGYRKKNCPQGAKTYHFLVYKSMLERRLNEALNTL